MPLTQDQKNRIGEVVKEILSRRIENFPESGSQIRNAPFHSAILECFREKLEPLRIEVPYLVAIASWLHGLNTSLGSGFENIAHILSGGYKRKFTGPYILKVKQAQATQIETIIRILKSGEQRPDVDRENSLIFECLGRGKPIDALEFTVDVFIETKREIVGVELKSVRPNSGEGRGEKQKILYAKAALKLAYPQKNIRYYIGFPFDPTSNDAVGYNKERFFDYLIEFKKFFAHEEILIADELWNFLSGSEKTMSAILSVVTNTVRQVRTQ